MLVIPRKKNESIVIRDHIILTVTEIRENEVLLEIDHPDWTTVCRGEAQDGIRRETQELAPVD
jgi:carbon storage regulator CsrA